MDSDALAPTPTSAGESRAYPKPSDIGGTLIRRVMATFKAQIAQNKSVAAKVKLPLQGKIAIATSGGVDSMVLAHLICTYGRKIVADPKKQITLLHFDHQWRIESSTHEKRAVEAAAQRMGVGFLSVRLESPKAVLKSENLEEDARIKRQEQYNRLRKGRAGFKWVLTAHQEDDVVETLVWRFFRGELFRQSDGIYFFHDHRLRPLLQVRKEEIYAYARAEGVPYFEDPTNRSTDQMRGYFREELFPQLEARFPGFKASIMQYVKIQRKS